MRETELARIDLNLLVTLRALLETRSVGRTAIRLNMSQPAVSRALARLRLVFGDRLLVKAGAGMLETPRAAALLEPVRKALAGLEEVLDGGQRFNPETSERVFRIASTDYGASAVLPSLMARITAMAPLGGIEIVPMTPGYFRDLGTGELDLVLFTGGGAPAHLSSDDLFREDYVCVIRAGHPVLREAQGSKISLDSYLAWPHVLVTVHGGRTGLVCDKLRSIGRERRIVLWLPYFGAAVAATLASDLILTIPRRIAANASKASQLVFLEPPVDLDGFDYRMIWHPRSDDDAGHRWLRMSMKDACEDNHI